MVYPAHALMQFGGKLDLHASGDRGEIWSCGIRLRGGDGGFLSDPETYIDVQVPKLKSWFTSNLNQQRGDASLEWVKINNINAAGHYRDATTTERHFTPVNGGGSTNAWPSYLTVVWSWTTGIGRGLAHRGRMYPPNSGVWNAGSSITLASKNEHATAAYNFLTAASGALPETEGGQLVVVSGIGAGAYHNITGLQVGDVVDVQRKRRNASVESYASASFG